MSGSGHITVTNVSKIYELGNSQVVALDNVSLDISRGEFIIIVGPSGSGKSTLVNIIGGVDTPDNGDVTVADMKLTQMNAGELTKYRRNHVGFLFQFYSLIPTLTAMENVLIAAELVKIKGDELKSRGNEVLEAVGLADRGDSYPSQLSGGERQRVALARALAKYPDLIMVDEPTGQLDFESGRRMIELIKRVASTYGSTVIMVTHDITLLDLADRVIHMQSGKILEE